MFRAQLAGSLLVPGQKLGRYEILCEIAHGGMAAVYLARKRFEVAGLGKLVAVKVLLPHLRDPEFVQMFLDEARIALSIAHPNVVQVIDVGESDGNPHIVMEYLRGQSLNALAKRGAPDHNGLVFQVLAQAAAGLHGAHETRSEDGEPLGIVHRDVTPQNIHVGYDGNVKIVDFGIAASRGRLTSTKSGQLKGTFHYLAPEQITRSRDIDRRVDVWALGVIAWEMMTLEPLFRSDSEATTLWNVVNKTVPDVRERAPQIPDFVATAIMACLAREPSRRPRDVHDLEEAFSRAAELEGVAKPRELATRMQQLFANERTVDEQREATAITSAPPSQRAGTEGVETTVRDAETVASTAPTRRSRARAIIIAASLAASAAVAFVLGTRPSEPKAASLPPAPPAAAEAPPPAPADQVQPPPPAVEPAPKPESKPSIARTKQRHAPARTKPPEKPAEPPPKPAPEPPPKEKPLMDNPYK